ncbi:cysteine desulfurase family protein [Novosphingopyxis sp. YJ-S2-01]|uniref:cysteine desulfurase family protein n=1 Tax=Novosphingopyxis sp. YJ-S2-01 TaxID=2794021 RepID=UPI0018DB29E4|nr:cysteine desulfurase family protein [Novosphingopyxis sp. YJ-S2-01]MBH9537402.1 cysteine desulfurase [Novosphingopyxis sp. YJ-S2-01]
MTHPIYLDYQATTPMAPEAAEAMRRWIEAGFWNPHSAHRGGRQAAAAVEVARGQVAALMPDGGRTVFTSGATEAINMALIGAMRAAPPGRRKLVTIATEHAAVRDTAFWLEREGFDLVLLPVDAEGIVDRKAARAAIDDSSAIVAVMAVNNEIGVIQPLDELAALAHDAGALFFCDAVQAYGRVSLPGGADMIAVSAHKVHGPKGIGALWLREGVEIPPLLHGGGQEQGLRSGTLSPALCAGFGAAAQLMAERADEDADHVQALWKTAREAFSGWTLNGSAARRYHGNLNIRREGLDVARLMSDVRGVLFSAGSACASGSGRPSHVLAALGLADPQIKSSIRLGFGRYSTAKELKAAADLINRAAEAQ